MTSGRTYSAVSWLQPAYYHRELVPLIKRAKKQISDFRKTQPIGAIAFRGYSGASVAPILSWELNIPLIAVRKKMSHDSNMAFGITSAKNYIIIDDFISTGDTIRAIVNNVNALYDSQYKARPKLVGIFLYYDVLYQKYCGERTSLGEIIQYYTIEGYLKDVPVIYVGYDYGKY
jgi:hypoxanthine phosphoribosyltransferase